MRAKTDPSKFTYIGVPMGMLSDLAILDIGLRHRLVFNRIIELFFADHAYKKNITATAITLEELEHSAESKSHSHIGKVLKDLQEWGLIKICKNGKGRGATNTYKITDERFLPLHLRKGRGTKEKVPLKTRK